MNRPLTQRVRLIGFEPAAGALLTEWLQGVGMHALITDDVDQAGPGAGAEAGAMTGEPDGVLAQLPFPRHDARSEVDRLRQRWPRTALLLLSPTFHPGVEAEGPLARELGVNAVLPMPVSRLALLGAVHKALAPSVNVALAPSMNEALAPSVNEALAPSVNDALEPTTREAPR